LVSLLRLVQRWTAGLAAIVLLNFSLTFYNVWPTPRIRWQGHLSAELAAVVVGLAVWLGRTRATTARGRAIKVLGGIWVALVVGRYLDVMAPALYGRPINLYWDARHLAAVASMLTDSIPAAVIAGVVAAVVAGLAVGYFAARWAWGAVAALLAHPWDRRILATVALVLLAVWGAERLGGFAPAHPQFSPTVSQAYWRHARVLATQLTRHSAAVVSSRQATESDLQNVRGADVYLVFVESYGAVSYDRPDVKERIAPRRAQFAADVRESGRQVVSAFVDSPTFGGSSWLAHVTLMTGVEARDEDTNVLLMSQRRDTLVSTFARHGYRTVALMPGLTKRWPEGAFYRFDHVYDTAQLAYAGPRFGWWTVPDQFALARLDLLERGQHGGASGPRFVFFPTTSTHAPFGPTAPYQPDWVRVATDEPYAEPDVTEALAHPPDYEDLSPSYANAVSYAYSSIGGYLRRHADRDIVMVMLGDHQPAAAVSGENASWDVPAHVIASRPALLDRLRARGFHDGMSPPRRAIGPMHELLPTLLEAFGNRSQNRDQRAVGVGAGSHNAAGRKTPPHNPTPKKIKKKY
jgi:hypothetical protein